MKIKTTKICDAKYCKKKFKMRRTTDKYCSSDCCYKSTANKINNNPLKECANKDCKQSFKQYKTTDKYCFQCTLKKHKKIKPRSTNRAREEAKYNRDIKPFLNKNTICPVAQYFLRHKPTEAKELKEWAANIKTNQVHHKAGRTGKLLLFKPYWLAVSQKGHDYIHANPNFSLNNNWIILRTTVNHDEI